MAPIPHGPGKRPRSVVLHLARPPRPRPAATSGDHPSFGVHNRCISRVPCSPAHWLQRHLARRERGQEIQLVITWAGRRVVRRVVPTTHTVRAGAGRCAARLGNRRGLMLVADLSILGILQNGHGQGGAVTSAAPETDLDEPTITNGGRATRVAGRVRYPMRVIREQPKTTGLSCAVTTVTAAAAGSLAALGRGLVRERRTQWLLGAVNPGTLPRRASLRPMKRTRRERPGKTLKGF